MQLYRVFLSYRVREGNQLQLILQVYVSERFNKSCVLELPLLTISVARLFFLFYKLYFYFVLLF